jgi:V8-like Glu-specific endopeptidase
MMTVQLTSSDFKKLVDIVAKDANFRNVKERVRLLAGALEGSPRANDILSTLDLDGAPRGVAVEVVQRLSNFGRVTIDKEALGVFLNYLLFFKGEVDVEADFIRGLIGAYQLDRPMILDSEISEWRGDETSAAIQEKIIGENTLRHIRILELGLDAARAVVHVSIPGGSGSGFMIASDLLVTNHHVVENVQTAIAGTYTFFYELGRDGKQKPVIAASAHAEGIFYTNKELDYTVIQLADVPSFGEPLKPRPVVMHRDDRVTIIQHPGGHYKKVSLQNNFVAYADSRVVQYTTSTMPGSSGSPVLDDDFRVVAIHHSGGMIAEPDTQRRYLRNEGISMVSILQDIQLQAPEICARLGLSH